MSVKLFLGWLGLLFTLRWLISANSSWPIYIIILSRFYVIKFKICLNILSRGAYPLFITIVLSDSCAGKSNIFGNKIIISSN